MATTFCGVNYIVEDQTSPSFVAAGINSTMQRKYNISASSLSNALTLAKAAAPATATVDSVPLEAPRVISIQAKSTFTFVATVDYKHAGRDEQENEELIDIGDERVSADFTGETYHIGTAKAQTSYGDEAPDVGLGVNVDYDGTVNGTEINKRTGSFVVEVLISEATATNAWFKARFLQVWTFNDATFRSWEAGSIALTGISSRQRSDGNWDVGYSFQIFPNEAGVDEIGGVEIDPPVDLKGSQYKWVMHRPKELDGKLVPEPIGAYVGDVYDPETDFADLGIST